MAEIRWINKNVLMEMCTQKWLKMVVSAFFNSGKNPSEVVNLSSICRQQFYTSLYNTTPVSGPCRSAQLCP